MDNGDRKNDVKREGSKGPVLHVVEDVPRGHHNSLPLEGSGSQRGTVSSLNFKEDSLQEFGVNDLEILLVKSKKFDTEADLLTIET